MGNLESDWDFATSSLALAVTNDHFALRIGQPLLVKP